MRRIVVVACGIVGVGLGALSGRILFGGSAWNLIPWAIIALAIGLIVHDRRTALIGSGLYGYLLCAVFLYVANTSGTPLAQRVLFALALALIGPVCAIALTLISPAVSLRFDRRAKRT